MNTPKTHFPILVWVFVSNSNVNNDINDIHNVKMCCVAPRGPFAKCWLQQIGKNIPRKQEFPCYKFCYKAFSSYIVYDFEWINTAIYKQKSRVMKP